MRHLLILVACSITGCATARPATWLAPLVSEVEHTYRTHDIVSIETGNFAVYRPREPVAKFTLTPNMHKQMAQDRAAGSISCYGVLGLWDPNYKQPTKVVYGYYEANRPTIDPDLKVWLTQGSPTGGWGYSDTTQWPPSIPKP